MGIQIARGRGWRVAASASAHNHDYMRSLGAEATVDYHQPQWPARIRRWMANGVDAALAVQPGTTAESMLVVDDRGSVITISGDVVVAERGIRVGMVDYDLDVRDDLARLMGKVAKKEMHLEIERVYPFQEALEALARVGSDQARSRQARVALGIGRWSPIAEPPTDPESAERLCATHDVGRRWRIRHRSPAVACWMAEVNTADRSTSGGSGRLGYAG